MTPNKDPFSLFDAAGIQQYVRQILKQSIPGMDPRAGTAHYDTEMTETPQHIIVKIHIAALSEARKLTLQVAPTQVKLEKKMTDQEHEQWIRLPHPVIPTSCRAVYKNGIMQLHMRKQDKDELFYEIEVSYP